MGNDTAASRRIAVIAVHGVSDQKLGDTAQMLAELLVSQSPNAATYDRGHRSDVLLQVTPLDPVTHLATTAGGIRKDLRQSLAFRLSTPGRNSSRHGAYVGCKVGKRQPGR